MFYGELHLIILTIRQHLLIHEGAVHSIFIRLSIRYMKIVVIM